jgi:hypothetical protein
VPKGQKPYASPSKKLEANADLVSRRAAVDRMPESLAKQKAQTKLNVDENNRARLFKADGGAIRKGNIAMGAMTGAGYTPRMTPKGVGGMERPMARMPGAAPASPKSRLAMMSNGGKAKKGKC